MTFQQPTPQTQSLAHIANRPGLLARVGAAFEAFMSPAFGPGTPPAPSQATQDEGLRTRQYRPGVNLSYTPRSSENLTPFSSLINLAANYDVLAICIAYWCEQISSLDWNIISLDEAHPASDAQLREAQAWIEKPDAVHSLAEWLTAAMDEVLVTDALSIAPVYTRGGKVTAFELIDGATIAVKTDANGGVAAPPGIAYQQVLYGVPWWEGTRDQLIYVPKNRKTRSQYGHSPTEDLNITINRALRRQGQDLAHYTVGNEPESLVTVPKEMTTDEIRDWQSYWDTMLSTPRARAGMRFVPGGDGWNVHEFKSPVNDVIVETWLAQITAARLGVPPQEIGLTADVNKATSGGQENVQFRRRQPYLRYFAAIFDRMLAMAGYAGCAFQFAGMVPEEDALAQAQTDEIYVRIGVRTPDDIKRRLGDTDLIGAINAVYLPTGPVPVLTQKILDDQTAAAAAATEAAQAQAEARTAALNDPANAQAPGAEDDDASEENIAADGERAPGSENDDVERTVREVRQFERVTRRGADKGARFPVA